MQKFISTFFILMMFGLSACGSNSISNGPANPETQLNSKSKVVPNTGNEEVNKENDIGIPNTGGIINDPSLEKPK